MAKICFSHFLYSQNKFNSSGVFTQGHVGAFHPFPKDQLCYIPREKISSFSNWTSLNRGALKS